MMTTDGFPGMAASDLGLNLSQQVKDESEEERKKRLLAQSQRAALGPLGQTAAQTLGLAPYG